MEIRWRNIVALALLVFALVVVVHALPEITEFLSTMRHMGPSGDRDDRMFGLMAFGLVALTVVAVVRILKAN